MMNRFVSLGLFMTVLSLSGRSEWVSLKHGASQPVSPRVTLLQDDAGGTVFKIEVSGFEVNEFPAEGKSYQSVSIMTDMFTRTIGSPEVPYIAQMLAIPDRGGVDVEVVETGEVLKFTGFTLPPARPSSPEGMPEPGYVENAAAYQSTAAYPEIWAQVDEPVVFRDFRVARVSVYPVHYVPETKEVQVVSSLTVRVLYGNGPGTNPRTSARHQIPPSFGAVYRSSLLNYKSVLDRDYSGLEAGRDVLLCIVPDTFAITFKTYAEWKHKTGIFVKVTKFSEIGANSSNPDIIKNYIAQCYYLWQYPPTDVLLVGDYGQVPIRPEPTQSFAVEDYYVEIDGNDVFPEIFIGRFTHDLNSNYGLQTIINKLIKYERNPYRVNQDWFKHAVLCANTVVISQQNTKRFVSSVMIGDGGFVVDTMLNPMSGGCLHQLPEVVAALNSGRGFLNYRGEGGSAGWWATCYPFSTTSSPPVSSVNNGEMLTFVTSIGCGVANFTAANSFGEVWLELGTPTSSRGASAFIGPTWGNTHAIYNDEIDKGLHVALLREGLETPGQTLLRGKIRMYNVYGGSDPQVLWHFRTYTVLGDPTTHVWKEVPKPLSISYPPRVPVGYTQIEVTVRDSATLLPVRGARVCLAGDSLFVTDTTVATGIARIACTAPTVDTLSLLVRGVAIVPAEGSVIVSADSEYVAPVGDPVITDLDGNMDGKVNPNEHIQISYVLRNWGTQPSVNVQATLACSDTHHVQIVNAGPVSYGTLPRNGSGSGSGTPLQFYVRATTPIGSVLPLRLDVTSSTSSWSYVTNQAVLGCNVQYVATAVNDEGSQRHNWRLDPGETAIIHLTVTNTGVDVAPNVEGILRSVDPYITILDSVASFGTLAIGGSSTSTANSFVVAVDDSCPRGRSAAFAVQLSTRNGNYPYSVVRDFPIPVGQPSPTDPSGPDGYGYYAYSSDDTLYDQAPPFNWVETRGAGIQVPFAGGGNFTTTVTLPFTFKYYGRNQTQVRISSDGWMAFGSGSQTIYINSALPYLDIVNNMVAPFWDDLFEGTSNQISKLLYYPDIPHHRFIAQWDSVGHYSGTTLRETFQVILLDPQYYPTPTGDGEIIFQYKVVGEEGSCSIGMEDSTQRIGMSYLFNSLYDSTATYIRDGMAIRITTKSPSLVVSVGDPNRGREVIPTGYALEQNFPNPFNPSTVITYALPMESRVSLKVYNVLGQEVCTLVDEVQSAGEKLVRWDSETGRGLQAASGVYFTRLHVEGVNGVVYSRMRKMILMK